MLKIIYKISSILLDSLFPIKKFDRILLSQTKEQAYFQLPKSTQPPFNFIKSVFAYKDEIVTSLIWNIKYKKSTKAIEIGGFALYNKILEIFDINQESILLIPIPISKKRKKERGYNQCELLLEEIIKLDINKKILFSKNLLHRKVHKERQTLKNRADRIRDAQKIFEINQTELEKIKIDYIKNIQITKKLIFIIIDDVVTTGSTMKEAVDLIKSTNLGKVIGLSLAH